MAPPPRVAVVVPVHNNLARTLRFLRSFRDVTYPHYTVVIADDGSADGTGAALARDFPSVVVLRGDGNLWWSGATNLGVRYALGHGFDYVLTINNDALVRPDFLGRLVATAQANPRSIVGSRLNYQHDPARVWAVGSCMRWHVGRLFHLCEHDAGEAEVLARGPNPRPVEALTGCGTLVPAACFREVGLYDAKWFPQYHGDAEFVLRARRRGWRALVDLQAVVFNDAGNSCTDTVRGYHQHLFSRRSWVYWRPVAAVHLRYCPWRYLLTSWWQFYGWFVWYYDPRSQRLKRAVKRALGRAA
ncbi:MAG TPA: glycosyltransferase family 2 protein [Gemmataceae bacterium]|nr:glycosyltransferase family 2 protein [Gemmataceae bacterium]